MRQPSDRNDTEASRNGPARSATDRRPRLLMVSGILTPYTHALFEKVAERHQLDMQVLTCSDAEPSRDWCLPEARSYARATMKGLRWHLGYVRHIYVNPSVMLWIARTRPDVVMVSDFSPTMLMATMTARFLRIPVVLGSDTQRSVDPGETSFPHRVARRLIAPFVSAAIGASGATVDFFVHYGIPRERTVVSPIVPAWTHEGPLPTREERPWDILFCGLIDDQYKGALHFIDVVKELRERGRTPRIRVVGDGPLRQRMHDELQALGVEARFDGYIQQNEIADAYLSSRLLLFPSRGDSWGLVANEAAQCGTPVLISPHAQAAFDLVEAFGCGAVVPLDIEKWADTVELYLDDEDIWNEASSAGLAARRQFSLAGAADGFFSGIEMALGRHGASGTRKRDLPGKMTEPAAAEWTRS